MIDSATHIAAQQFLKPNVLGPNGLKGVEFPNATQGLSQPASVKTFDNVVGKLIQEVDQKDKTAVAETNRMLLGETDNVHQSMVAMQEAGLAFNLLVEVRNKLVQSYQELMKMPV